jgi:chaperonin GroES
MSISKLIEDITKTNLAVGMDETKLEDLGQECFRGYSDDLTDPDRVKWAKNLEEYIDLAMQITQSKSDPWEGCANIKTPLLTEAAIQFNARAYPAIIPSGNIVKCKTNGDDSQGVKADRGDRVGKHMSYQLREEMVEWEDDMDKALLILPILGCFFKKTFYNVDIARNESKLVMPQNLIMEYKTPSIDRAPRLSEAIEFYPREVEEKKRRKTWLDVDIVYEDEEKEALEEFITQHTYLDLYDHGYKCPYIITFHKKEQKVVRIVANYTESDIYYNDGTEIIDVASIKEDIDNRNIEIESNNIEALAIANQAGSTEDVEQVPKVEYPNFNKYKVSRVDSTKYYTKYSFLPSPDGSIYDLGLGQLMGSLTDATDTLINQMLDAGTLSNLQGGIMAKGVKTPAGTGRVNTNEWTKVETGGMSLKDAVLPFNFKGPSAVAFNLLGFLVDSAKAVANLKDILSGDAPQGETATTSMIKREEGMRIYNAIYKRVYRAFKQELIKLYNLNALYLPQEVYFAVMDEEAAVKRTDYSIDQTDVTPTADPNESMASQKILKAEAGLQFVGDPEVNSYELKRRYFEAIDMPEIDRVLPPPSDEPKPPDPLLVKTTAEVQKLEAETKKLVLETAEIISKIIKNLADAESKEAGQQLDMLKIHADYLIKKGVENDKAGGAGMEATPDNAGGVEALPQEAAGGAAPLV